MKMWTMREREEQEQGKGEEKGSEIAASVHYELVYQWDQVSEHRPWNDIPKKIWG